MSAGLAGAVPLGLALAVALILAWVLTRRRVRGLALDRPNERSLHRDPVPRTGGLAIVGGVFAGWLLLHPPFHLAVTLTLLALASLSFIDDVRSLPVTVRLLAHLAAGGIVMTVFPGLPLLLWLAGMLGVAWMINLYNFMDGSDGLAGGMAFFGFGFYGAAAALQGDVGYACAAWVVSAAALGFLVFNFHPARIFMGDSGSLFLGFSVAYLSLAIQHTARNSTGVLVLLIPIGLMAIPIMDTTLVTIRRILSGRRIDQGGRDHTSHRLVALGLSERQAVLLLYLISAIWGLVIFLLYGSDTTTVLLLIGLLTIFSVIFTMYLSSVRVYSETEEKLAYLRSRGQAMGSVFGLRFLLMHKKLILGISVDMIIVSLSFFMAARSTQIDLGGDFRLLGVFILLRILSFYLFDLYNRVWRYVATHELLGHLYAVVFSSAAVFIVNRVFGFGPRLTNSFFLTDFFVTLSGLIFSRLMWRALREYFDRTAASRKQRVLIYGAADGGYILIREIIQNYRYGMSPVGFLDDDPAKRNMSIAGVRIFGGLEDLAEAIRRTQAEVVVTSMRHLDPERRARLESLVAEAGVALKRFEVSISEG